MSGSWLRWGVGPVIRTGVTLLGLLYAWLRFGPAAGLSASMAAAVVIALDGLVLAGPTRGVAGVSTRAAAGLGQMLVMALLFFGPAPLGFGSLPAPVFLQSPLLLLLFCLAASWMDPQRPILTPLMGLACGVLWWRTRSFALAQAGVLKHDRAYDATIKSPVALMTHRTGPHYFNESSWQGDLVYVFLTFTLLTIMVWRTWRLAGVSARREASRNALAAYFAPQVVDAILKGGAEGFRPRRLEVAVMESDLVGFTRLAEALTPEAAAEALSRYRRAVEEAVFAEEGAILSWTGDGATAVFGLQGSGAVAAARAIRCARKLQADWPETAAQSPGAGLALGVGVDFGEALMGLVGEGGQMSLVLLGAPAAGAERLQAETRSAHAKVLASAAAKAAAKSSDPASVAALSRHPIGAETAWAI